LPQVNPGTIILLVAAALGGAWAAGLLRMRLDDGRLTIRVSRAGRVVATFDLRDTGLLLILAVVMGWAVAIAVERSAWVPDTDGRLVPALALATAIGWLLIVAGLSRLAYLVASIPVVVASLLWFTPSPLTGPSVSMAALGKWVQALPDQTNLLFLIGLIVMMVVTGLWTSWWTFRRRNGLVALLPTGTILAVEIINDVSPGPVFFTVVWLASAASLLLRLNFVALKEGWRTRRVPHAADTGWTFGEVGIEATVGILAIAFLILPPLSNADISGMLIPGVVHADAFHPFGIGGGSSPGGDVGSVGYSELVRPGSQLTAKPKTVMYVTGDTPTFYPYWRGIALAGWDGIEWYPLPSTPEVPVRQQPLLAAHATLPRDDLPASSQRIQLVHNTFHVIVPPVANTVFSGGEIISVDNQPSVVRGIMTSVGTPVNGPVPALVNVTGDSTPTTPFDTVDRIQLAKRLQAPYSYSVTEAIPNVDVQDLQAAGTDYPAWLTPYINLYQDGRIAQGYSVERDTEIAALAKSIVQAAGATTPYDQAKAIESWFIAKGRFSYTLTPPKTPTGVRPLDYFLFTSKKGFCQDFSTAMNVMLRTLGIPSRQMSGYGQGNFDEKTHQYIVNAVEAHSWVEVFFPGYGWIPFEPTPDGTNAPISRPQTRDQLNAPTAAVPQASGTIRPNLAEQNRSAGTANTGAVFPDIWRPLLLAAGVALLLIVIGCLLAFRWLFAARDVPRIWRRLLFLGDRLRVTRRTGDTPQEFGGRLADSLQPLEAEVRQLARLYTRASFRQGGLSPDETAAARAAWRRIRGSYPALVARAWRDALRRGQVVREEDAVSESREPSRRR
jgi:transglutaminase-like putative cysteine protease